MPRRLPRRNHAIVTSGTGICFRFTVIKTRAQKSNRIGMTGVTGLGRYNMLGRHRGRDNTFTFGVTTRAIARRAFENTPHVTGGTFRRVMRTG